jgi:hypothetical protein
MLRIGLILLMAFLCPPLTAAPEIDVTEVKTLVVQKNMNALKSMGTDVLPILVQMYAASSEKQKAEIAETFYKLGWKSPEAKRVLMTDIHTQNQNLRLQVQWALGRVSSDTDVVDVLLDKMRNDASPLFRDKAACALAYDQIHLTEKEKVRLYEGLISALSDPKLDVRMIALLALNIHTGQTRGFSANASTPQRDAAIRQWQKWLDEYRSR